MISSNLPTDHWLELNKKRLDGLSHKMRRDSAGDFFFSLGILDEFETFDHYNNGSPVLDRDGERVVCRRRNVMPLLTEAEQLLYSTVADLKVASKGISSCGLTSAFERAKSPPVNAAIRLNDQDMLDIVGNRPERFKELQALCLYKRKAILPELEADLADYITPAISALMSRENDVRELSVPQRCETPNTLRLDD